MLSSQANKVVWGQRESWEGYSRQREQHERRPRIRERAWGVLGLQQRVSQLMVQWGGQSGEVVGGNPGG